MVLAVGGKGRAAELTLLGEPTQWSLVELRIAGVPAAANPFDPEAIRVDAVLRAPSGGQQAVPGFYHRAYLRGLVGGEERLSGAKTPEWRLRFRPVEEGPHAVTATIFTNSQPAGPTITLDFIVAANPKLPARRGVVRIAANRYHFETGDGQALPLIGLDEAHPCRGPGGFPR